MDLDDLLNLLRTEVRDCLARAASFEEAKRKAEHEADTIASRIQGIEEAREALKPRSGQEIEIIAKEVRKPRRDIRGMVREAMAAENYGMETQDTLVHKLSAKLECRPSQIEAALRALNGEAA